MSNVSLHHITKRFENITALQDVTFSIKDGEFFVLLGPTGAGKTTSLRIIAGLERQDEGSVLFDDEVVDAVMPADRDIAFVFQQYSLYPTMSVYDNLAFPLRSPLRRTPEPEIRQWVEKTAETLRISHLLERKTARLSGGEMQRVSIGRAIIRKPRIFLMDEPLSNLDAKLREALRVELQHLQRTQGSTTLFVTHDQVEALTMADRIAVLNNGQIIQLGNPEDIYDRPASMFVAQLIGTPGINLLAANRQNGQLQIENSAISFPLGGPTAEKLPARFMMGIRPEDIQPSQAGEFSGEVSLIEPLGAETILHLKTGQQTLLSMISGPARWKIGETVRFKVVYEHLHYFDQASQNRIETDIKEKP
jgi:multiple sugar transport system ATP-binding protein